MVWLWAAGSAQGVTDDREKARAAAACFMSGTGADAAVVELAHYVSGTDTLVTGYRKAGALRWVARRYPGGQVTWKPAPPVPEPAAA
jgi:hypothetical protein